MATTRPRGGSDVGHGDVTMGRLHGPTRRAQDLGYERAASRPFVRQIPHRDGQGAPSTPGAQRPGVRAPRQDHGVVQGALAARSVTSAWGVAAIVERGLAWIASTQLTARKKKPRIRQPGGPASPVVHQRLRLAAGRSSPVATSIGRMVFASLPSCRRRVARTRPFWEGAIQATEEAARPGSPSVGRRARGPRTERCSRHQGTAWASIPAGSAIRNHGRRRSVARSRSVRKVVGDARRSPSKCGHSRTYSAASWPCALCQGRTSSSFRPRASGRDRGSRRPPDYRWCRRSASRGASRDFVAMGISSARVG